MHLIAQIIIIFTVSLNTLGFNLGKLPRFWMFRGRGRRASAVSWNTCSACRKPGPDPWHSRWGNGECQEQLPSTARCGPIRTQGRVGTRRQGQAVVKNLLHFFCLLWAHTGPCSKLPQILCSRTPLAKGRARHICSARNRTQGLAACKVRDVTPRLSL